MAVVSAQGTTVPFTPGGKPYPAFGNLVPVLRSFRLTYPHPHDHEMALIQVLVGGNSQDLTPNAALNPANIPDGRLEVTFQDANPSGEEFGYLVSHSTLRVRGARRFQIRDLGCVNECVRELPSEVFGSGPLQPLSQQPLLALVGFKLFFTGGRDRELDRIGVWFRDNELHVALRDRSGDETFGYLVDFVAIPTTGLNVNTDIETDTSNTLQTIPFPTPPRAHSLLTGWMFNFRGRIDRRILDLGVVRRKDDFTVMYSDASGGETFDWRVEWAHVAPMVIAPPNF